MDHIFNYCSKTHLFPDKHKELLDLQNYTQSQNTQYYKAFWQFMVKSCNDLGTGFVGHHSWTAGTSTHKWV